MEQQKIKSLIVEDELYDRQIITKILCSYYNNYIEVMDSVGTVDEAIKSINKHQPQLIFMDIELNGNRNGAFNILEKVNKNLKIIFVTAKNDQDDLLKAIKLSCIDYIIKPTKISDFEAPIKKVFEELKNEPKSYIHNLEVFKHNVEIRNIQESKISLQDGFSYKPTYIRDIIYCKAESNYTQFTFTDNTNLLINGNLKSFEDRLNGFGFCRISKSDLINLTHIKYFSRKNISWEVQMINNKTLYISPQRKQSFLIRYNDFHLQ